MKESFKILLLGLLIGAAIGASLISLTHCINVGLELSPPADGDTVSVVVVHDTVTVTRPVAVESRPTGLRRITLPVYRYTATDVNDVAVNDSADVLVPIEQKVYTDSANYWAVVSGYRVSLDTLAVFRQREYITERIKPPANRWGLSLGIGPVVGTDMKIRPGLFVGATYTFLTF